MVVFNLGPGQEWPSVRAPDHAPAGCLTIVGTQLPNFDFDGATHRKPTQPAPIGLFLKHKHQQKSERDGAYPTLSSAHLRLLFD